VGSGLDGVTSASRADSRSDSRSPGGGASGGAAGGAGRVVGTAAKQQKIGRNEPCYCGSGKKFKLCHGAN
jgi:preprotein translocase subunit SecA